MTNTDNDIQVRLDAELTSRITGLLDAIEPSMVILPIHLVPVIRKLEKFVPKLGGTTNSTVIGWYEGLVVLKSRIAARLYVF